MNLTGQNIIVLDLETANSADDCRHCGQPIDHHDMAFRYCGASPLHGDPTRFEALGWHNKPALGLSIGCYYDYRDSRMHWFDVHSLEATVRYFVETQPLLVSFNGIGFDFVLMRGLLRRRAEAMTAAQEAGECQLDAEELIALCNTFKAHCAMSYDLLDQIWRQDPDNKFQKGNSLGAISQASGLGAKLSHGAQAPRDWRDGQYAKVLNYCQDDVLKTKALFEMVCAGQPIYRGNGLPITLPIPAAFAALED